MNQPFFQTRTGEIIYLKNISSDQINILDIATSLSKICRYAGNCNQFYSVAEHCCHVSDCCKDYPLWGLLHDAVEAYMGDIPRPVKNMIPEIWELETQLSMAVAERFRLDPILMPKEVLDIDRRITMDEYLSLFLPISDKLWGDDFGEPLGVLIECWDPLTAYREFAERFNKYF